MIIPPEMETRLAAVSYEAPIANEPRMAAVMACLDMGLSFEAGVLLTNGVAKLLEDHEPGGDLKYAVMLTENAGLDLDGAQRLFSSLLAPS